MMAQPGDEPLLYLEVDEAKRRVFLGEQANAQQQQPHVRVDRGERREQAELAQQRERPEVRQSEAVSLPEFWVSDPNMWFARAEAVFRRAGVNSSIVLYDYVLMKLPEDVLRSVRDLVQSVSDESRDAYEQLKHRLLSSYGMSK
jgi:hypothetical protein